MRNGDLLPFPEMKERMHYIAWLAFSLLSFPTGGHAAILILCVSLGEYVDAQHLLLTLLAAAILVPVAYAWRKFGEKHCRFIEFDAALDLYFQRAGADSHVATLESLVAAIERTSGMERQLARNEAKAWLQAHVHELDTDAREFATQHLGYLCKW